LPGAFGDLGDLGDLGESGALEDFGASCNGETDNGSALSDADR